MRYLDEFRVPAAARELLREIRAGGGRGTFMEVCGTHTMAISKAGLRPLLAPDIDLISGPGCPVCVTADADIDRAIALANMPGVVLATFGDMMKVPGTEGSLASASARGASVEVIYSPLEALDLARSHPGKDVVFLGVGFETTAPTVAATVRQARRERLLNFYVLSFHKVVPPALRALVSLDDFRVDGFILPGHVSVIIGSDAYLFLPEEFGMPCVVTGFEATDILQAIARLMKMREQGAGLEVEYSRAVRPEGNPKALAIMDEVFEPCDAEWRGLFVIPGSGLRLRDGRRRLGGQTAGARARQGLPVRRDPLRSHKADGLPVLRRQMHAGHTGGPVHGIERGDLRIVLPVQRGRRDAGRRGRRWLRGSS
jgi:hydrogenase expression/formation protein HypD